MADDKVLITEGTLDNIADAIREKNGESHLYYPREMPAAIRRIPTGSGSGSVVAVYPILLDGTHIADIEVDGENFAIYAPTPKVYTQGTGIEISSSGVVSVSEALRTTIAGKVDSDTFTTAINSLTASLASKQNLLIAGNGITIQGNVISADGTDVEANPSGTPTDELNTIRIGEDIYEIVGGGGGVDTDMIAEEYDSTQYYTGKNFVIYNDALYYADFGDLSVTGDFNPALWTEINVTDGMLNLDSQLETSISNVSSAGARTRSFVASNYGSMASYANGDYVIKDNSLYKNIREDGGAGTGWDATKWQEISNLASEVKKVDKKIIYEYSTHDTYSVGDYTNHSGNIYRCTTAISTPEAFDSNKWQLISSVMDEMSEYSTLDGLRDTDFTNLSNGQIPKWNSTSGKWENANESGGGSSLPFNVVIDSNDNGINLVYDDGQ